MIVLNMSGSPPKGTQLLSNLLSRSCSWGVNISIAESLAIVMGLQAPPLSDTRFFLEFLACPLNVLCSSTFWQARFIGAVTSLA
jgi:hypothetical protein